MEWPSMDVDQGPGLLWAKVTLGEEGRRMVVESGPRHQVQPPPSVGANHPAHLPTCGKWSIQWMKLHSQDIICVYLSKTICHKTPAIPHQDFMWTVENIITYALRKHDHLIFIYISPSKQKRNIVQLCTSESHNNLQPTSGRFMESSKKTSLPSYLLQKARYDKDAHILELCVWEVRPVRESKSQTPNCIGAHLHLK